MDLWGVHHNLKPIEQRKVCIVHITLQNPKGCQKQEKKIDFKNSPT